MLSRNYSLVAIVAAMCAFPPTYAQNITGKLVGTVMDATGATVNGATVGVTQSETSASRKTTTDVSGNYTLDLLPPGNYKIYAEKAGFKRTIVQEFALQVNQTARVDISLQVGSVSESLEVQASAPLVESETSSIGQVVGTKQIQDLPLNGRTFFNLVLLSPAVTPTMPNSAIVGLHPVPGLLSAAAFNVAGAREQGNGFLIDGVDAQDPHVEVPSIFLSVDAIQEFRLETNAYSAEYGNHAAQVNVATRAGTNQWHGSLYEFLRNDGLDASDFFSNVTRTGKSKLRYNQFGGTFGGPVNLPKVYRGTNRTFFFLSSEGTRIRSGANTQLTVPSAAQRAGDLSLLGVLGNKPIFDPATTLSANGVISRQPIPGNVIPASRLSPFSQKTLAFYPLPNLSATVGNDFASQINNYSDSNQLLGRADHYFSERDTVFFRYAIYSGELSSHSAETNGGTTTNMTTQNMGLNYVHVFTPSTLNELRLGYNRPKYYQLQDGANGENITANLGIKNLIALGVPAAYGNPLITLSGFSSLGVGDILPTNQLTNTYEIVEQISLTRGNHSLKIGADLRKLNYNDETERQARGDFTFSGGLTTNPASPAGTGAAMADLLLGLPLNATGSRTSLKGAFNGFNYGFYAQDDWKVNSRLTLNLGLRYDLNTRLINTLNHLTGFDRSYPGGRLLLAGTNQSYIPGVGLGAGPNTPRGLLPSNLNDWGPRVGFALRPFGDNRTAIRAGYGIFYAQVELQDLRTWLRNPPFGEIVSVQSDQNGNSNSPSVLKVADLFPAQGSLVSQPTIYSPGDRYRDPYYQQWNLSVQRTVGRQIVVEAGYLGSKGTGLSQRINANQASLPADPAHPTSIQSRFPYPLFGTLIRVTNNDANSTYHAFISKVERRFSSGFSMLAAYTFSKSLDGASLIDDNTRNVYNFKLDKGRSDMDVRSNFVLSATYELPFGRAKPFVSSGAPAAILGGWQLNTITTVRSGFPVSINAQGDVCICGAAPQLAQQVGDPGSGFTQSRLKWFNTAAFAQPASGTLGSSGRNIISGPHSFTMNLSLFRTVRFGEKLSLQLRAEAFNLMNHTNFGQPGVTVGTPTFGVISSSDPARAVQFAAKLIF